MISLDQVKKLISRANATPSSEMNHRTLNDILAAQEKSKATHSAPVEPKLWWIVLWNKVGYPGAAILVISLLVACVVLSEKVANLRHELKQARRDVALAQQNVVSAPTHDMATINLYLKEYRDVITQQASFSPAAPPPAQMHVNRQDILYYEKFDEQPEYVRPGLIVRGPLSQGRISSSNAPTISNGHSLSLSEAQKDAPFNLVAPPCLYPYYKLDQIRKIEGRDALQLNYTNGINSLSLFEQSLDGRRGLEPKDFREYAVYRNRKQVGGTILAWRDDALSYVLIGNIELSQLMDMAQSISAAR